jgi:hypothetical protein
MAVRPLDQRLDQMATQDAVNLGQDIDLALASSDSPTEVATIPEISPELKAADGVQVAGLGSAGLGQVLSRIKARPTAPGPVKPVSPAAHEAQEISETQKAIVQTGVGTPTEARIVTKIEQAKGTAPTPEEIIAGQPAMAARTTEKPPAAVFNMPLMNTTEDVKQTIMVFAERTQKKRGTFADWKEAAEAAGFGPKFIDNLVNGKLPVSPENTIRASEAHVTAMEGVQGLTGKVADGSATPDEVAQLVQTVAFADLIQREASGYITNLAQSMAVLRMPRGSSREIAQIIASYGNDTDIVKFAQAYRSLTTPEGKAALIKSFAEGNAYEKFFTVYVNGLLSRPGTLTKQFLTNFVFPLVRLTERAGAAGIGAIRKSIGIGSDDVYEFAEIPAILGATPTGISNGWELAKKSFVDGVPASWVDPSAIARQQSRFELFNYKADGSFMSAATKALNFVVTLPGRSIMTSDEFFKTLNYSQELAAEATRVGIVARDDALKAGKTVAEASKIQNDAIDQFVLEPPDYIMGIAEKNTFTQKLEGMAGRIQEMTTPNTPLAFLVRTQMPFIGQPVNALSEALQRTLLAPFTATFRQAMKKGGKEADMAMTKVGLGSAAIYGFTKYATDGLITGAGPGEKGMRDSMTRQGWQQYSIVLDFGELSEEMRQRLSKFPTKVSYGSGDYAGKLFISYQNAVDPVGPLMAMAADYTDYARYEKDDSKVNAVAAGAVFGISNYMLESPFLQGISNVMSAFGQYRANDPGSTILLMDSLAQILTTTAIKSVTPLSGMLTSVKEQIDPTRRDYQVSANAPAGVQGLLDALNKFRAGTPGLSGDMEPLLNIWGEPVDHEYTWSPIRMKEGKRRPVDQSLIQLNASAAMPDRKVSMSVEVNGEKIPATTELTAAEYNRMLRIANKELNLEERVLEAIEFVKSGDAGDTSDFTDQKIIALAFSETFQKAKQLLLQDKMGEDIQKRISEKAKKLAQFGKGAR